jgi:CRISPR-associated endonuclease/helicase Cas3
MGIGKTEAALASAEILVSKFNQNGIYFGLPTQATANGIFARIRDWAKKCDDEKHTIRLAHGMTELNEEYRELFHGRALDSGDEKIFVHDWFEGKKQALLSDFVIATVDQFLLASLKQKHVMLRHLGLVGKVIIIDECHAYDAYMNEYLDNTLTWMGAYKVPVIILSATLPVKRRQELIEAYTKVYTDMNLKSCDSLAYPVLTWTDFDGVMQKEIKISLPDKFVSVNRINEEDMTDILKDKLSDGGCAAVIVNTVAYAQKLSEVIANEMPGYEVICFHSRFIATDRAKIEKELLERVGKNSGDKERNKLIVVGTQVLEQSLDIDFDYMITQLCPMDLLLQRCGRLHRHAKRIRPEKLEKAELAILKPSEDMNSVYSSWILKMTERYLPDELQIPQCISHLVNKVYEEPQTEEDINSEEYKEFEYVIKDKKYKAEKYCIVSDDLLKKRKNTIADFLQNVNNDADSEQAVRDIDETIEVLALCKNSDTLLDLVSGEISFDITKELSDEEAMLVAKERLRLPAYFSKNYNIKNTLNELEAVPKNWKNSKWLKGELLLILDENNDTELVHKKLHYSSARGLEYVKTE